MKTIEPVTKIKVISTLKKINYYIEFESNFFNKCYPTIDYGKKAGKLKFTSINEARDNYESYVQGDEEIFTRWSYILKNEHSTEEDLLLTVLEIFDWGKVWSSNVKKAIGMHKKHLLKNYISSCKSWLSSGETLKENKDILWSSGWTKVYSFLGEDIVIYDSRVSAFLNYTLTNQIKLSDPKMDSLKELTGYLFNFGGNNERKRVVGDSFGFKKNSSKSLTWFNANLVASWIISSLAEKLNMSTRDLEKAFFMLGFDLNQLKKNM